jgi:REP element-mobilizing transposase RayT
LSDRRVRNSAGNSMARFRKVQAQLSLASSVKADGRPRVVRGFGRPRRKNKVGRPRGRKTVSHDRRPDFARRFPQHVTLRTLADAPYLARIWLMKTIRAAVRESHKPTFRIVEFNVLGNHLHLVCEADGPVALARGVQGFEVRLVRRLNKALKRTGKLFGVRYHARSLETPKDVRNTLRYVLQNRKHHAAEQKFSKYWIDPFSSAPWFTGWAEPIRSQLDVAAEAKPTADATVWLLTTGWHARHGPLRFDERPL